MIGSPAKGNLSEALRIRRLQWNFIFLAVSLSMVTLKAIFDNMRTRNPTGGGIRVINISCHQDRCGQAKAYDAVGLVHLTHPLQAAAAPDHTGLCLVNNIYPCC